MNGKRLIEVMGQTSYSSPMNPHAVLPRYAAMCGFFGVPAMNTWDYRIYGIGDIEVPDEIVPRILALYYSEKQTYEIADGMRQMGKISVNIPSNINVWQKTQGASTLTSAAESLAKAATALATR
jgi:hypothetical protein